MRDESVITNHELEDDNISNENENLHKYKTISIDLSQKRTRKSTKNFNSDTDNNIKIEKKIDVMPIQNSINKINIFFQKYMESLELINAGLECKLNELKLKMERTQSEINIIKNDYSVDKDTFLKNYELSKNLIISINNYYKIQKIIKPELFDTLMNVDAFTNEENNEIKVKLIKLINFIKKHETEYDSSYIEQIKGYFNFLKIKNMFPKIISDINFQ